MLRTPGQKAVIVGSGIYSNTGMDHAVFLSTVQWKYESEFDPEKGLVYLSVSF